MENTSWQLNHTDTGYLDVQCTGLGGGELDKDWEVLLACRKEAHIYGPHWASRMTGRKEPAPLQSQHTPRIPPAASCHVPNRPSHLVPCPWSAWCPQLQAQIILRAKKVLENCPITPAHRKPPWPGYVQGLRLFTKLLVAHPLVGVCLPPTRRFKVSRVHGRFAVPSRHSTGSYAGMVWETILAEFPSIEGRTVLAAIAMPPSLLTRSTLSYSRQVHLIHHADDRLCVWTSSYQDVKLLQQQRLLVIHITGWRAYLGTAQHNYAHWTRATLPEGRDDLTALERIPGYSRLKSMHKLHSDSSHGAVLSLTKLPDASCASWLYCARNQLPQPRT